MRNVRFATPTAGKRTGTTAPASHRADLAHHPVDSLAHKGLSAFGLGLVHFMVAIGFTARTVIAISWKVRLVIYDFAAVFCESEFASSTLATVTS